MHQDDEYLAEEFNNSDHEKDAKNLGTQKTNPDQLKNTNKKQKNEHIDAYDNSGDHSQENGFNSKPLDKRERFSNLIIDKEAGVLSDKQPSKNKEVDKTEKQPLRNQLLEDDLSEIKGDQKSREEPMSAKSKSNFQFETLQGDRLHNQAGVKNKQKIHEDSDYQYEFDDEKPQRTQPEEQIRQKLQNGITSVSRGGKSDQKLGGPASQKINRSLDFRANIAEHNANPNTEQQHLEKLREQNKKLKQELSAIAKACDDALIQEKERKMTKGRENNKDHPELIEKHAQIKEQLSKVETLKSQIALMKRQLENTYNQAGVTDKENELRAIQKEIARVMEEKESLTKIKTEQHKALDYLKNESEYGTKLKIVSEELRKAKDENRSLLEQANENEKVLKKNHEKIVTLEEKVRDIKMKIQQKKNVDAHEKQEKTQNLKRQKDGKAERVERRSMPKYEVRKKERTPSYSNIEVNKNILRELEDKIKQLKDRKVEVDKKFNEDVKQLEQEKKESQIQSTKLQALIKEKEKEVRLNNLRLKEIKKLSRFNALKPIPKNKSRLDSPKNSSESHIDDGSKHESEAKQAKETKSYPSQRSNQINPTKRNSLKKTEQVPELKEKPESNTQSNQLLKKQGSNKDLNSAKHRDDDDLLDEQHYEDVKTSGMYSQKLIDRDEEVEDKDMYSKPNFQKKDSNEELEAY